uniref:RING-type domain-containing protein n=1 Tax=Leptobrachium leishanense TaxID=445787 RepID=A0A8C5P809_9ANUR
MDGPEPTIDIMEQDLLCPVCFSLFDEPQVLRCAHSFCKTCMDGVIQNSAVTIATPSSIACPVCRMETCGTGPDGPKDNFVLRGIVGKYKLIMASQKNSTCEVHAMQPLNMYCSTDHKLICGVCKILLEELIQELENRPDLLTAINTLKADRDKALQERSALKDQIKAYIGNLHHILDQRQNRMSSNLEARMASLSRDYNGELGRITCVHNEQRNALEMARGLRSASEPLLFMQEVRETVSLRQETPSPTVTGPTDSGSLRNLYVRTWDSIRLADAHTISLPAQDIQRTRRAPSTTSNSTWAWFSGVLLSTLMMAAFFATSFYGPDQHMSGHVTGEASDPVLAYWHLTVNKIAVLGERCQDFTMRYDF